MVNKLSWLKVSIVLASVLLLTLCLGFYLSVRKDEQKQVETVQTWTVDAEYVAQDEAMAENSSSSAADTRKKVTIIEVVPHQICSAFPYLVDWGTAEDYDENLPIGYEGLRYIMFRNSDGSIGGNWRNRITADGTPEQSATLYNYNVNLKNYYKEWVGINTEEYWRKYEDTNILNVNGYFEYVGEGKGLYDIDLTTLVEESDEDAYGIRYEMKALNRTAKENPQGEYTVNKPVCYVASDYMPGSNPDSTLIKQWTQYNYMMSFSCTSSAEKNYRIYDVIAKDDTTADLDFEYEAYLADGVTWDYGYEYQKDGNYQVKEVVGQKAALWEDEYDGLYLRIESTQKKDGASGVEAGYFKLYDAVADAGNITDDTMLYQVTFEADEEGKYVLTSAGITKVIEEKAADGSAYSEILFDYVGEGEGNYDVSFAYAPDGSGSIYLGQKYAGKLEEVRYKAGRYALASSAVEGEEELYIEGTGDYSKLITSIDCKGIDYASDTDGRTTNSGAPVGVSKGLTEGMYNYELNERGSWVFHTLEEGEEGGVTKVNELGKDIIYVYGQNLKKCYYEHNRFCNNEWFKLLVFLSNEAKTEPLAWQDYQNSGLTAKEIKEKYADEIAEFDRTYRIEILQKTPSQLTPDDVKNATLLYFAERVGLENLGSFWNTISTEFGRNLEYFTSAEVDLHYKDDLRGDTLMAIYKYCMYDQTTAIMLDMDRLRGNYLESSRYISSNLGKMLVFLDLLGHPRNFAEFIEGYPEYNPDYTMIDSETATATAYENKTNIYNLGKFYWKWAQEDPNEGLEIPPTITDTWDTYFFRIPEPEWMDTHYECNTGSSSAINGWKMDFPLGMGTCYNQDVQDDWTWYAPNYSTGIFNNANQILNIWKIIHNRNTKEESCPVVIIENADDSFISEEENVMPVYYYYVDDYSAAATSDFDVQIKINWTPEEMLTPTGLSSLVVKREDGSTAYSVSSPQYQPAGYTCNLAGDFVQNGLLNAAITQRDYKVTATDLNGKSDTVIVRFIVREAFMLN